MDFKFSNPAVEEMERRKIPIFFVEAVPERSTANPRTSSH